MALGFASGGMGDPMTTRGDVIIRNASNVTARLAIGAANTILSSNGTDISFQTRAALGLVVDPMTTRGDIIIRDAANATARLAIGATGTFLVSDGTDISYSRSLSSALTTGTQFDLTTTTAALTGNINAIGIDQNPIDPGSNIVRGIFFDQEISDATGTVRPIEMSSNNGALWSLGWWSESVTLSTTLATTDTTRTIPANSFIWGVDIRITTAVTGVDSTALQFGDATVATRFGSVTTFTAGTTGIGLNHLEGGVSTNSAGPIITSATAVRLTLSGGADNIPSGGVVRVTTRFITFGAATS